MYQTYMYIQYVRRILRDGGGGGGGGGVVPLHVNNIAYNSIYHNEKLDIL